MPASRCAVFLWKRRPPKIAALSYFIHAEMGEAWPSLLVAHGIELDDELAREREVKSEPPKLTDYDKQLEARYIAAGTLPKGPRLSQFYRAAKSEMHVRLNVTWSIRHVSYVLTVIVQPVVTNLQLLREVDDILAAAGLIQTDNSLARLEDILAGKRPRSVVEYERPW